MAYVTHETNPEAYRRRIAVLGAVGAVHGVMAVAILTGFAGGIIQEFKRKSLQAWTYMPPPPPPAPEQTARPTVQPRDTMPKPAPVPQTTPISGPNLTIDLGPLRTSESDPGGGLIPLPPLPTTAPGPSLAPRAAQPLGAPGKWVSPADYPTAALRRGDQGATRFELTISPAGLVRDCRVTKSSGSADLDAATCLRLTERARFTPARDERGDLVAGRYAGVIRWQIPE